MASTNVILAKHYDGHSDPTGWWMSEKRDGMRALWTGHKLVSRLGNTISAPAWFTEHFPRDMSLDGELWLRRGSGALQETVSIVKSGSVDKGWDRIWFLLIDIPDSKGPIFEFRQAALERFAATHKGRVRAIKQVMCTGVKHLAEQMNEVIKIGGEGIMLRKPGSLYEKKRSSTLLKVVRFYTAEAKVIGYAPGKGKHKGRIGTLVCRLPNGVEFEIGTGLSDYEREHPPRIGSKVTFKYKSITPSGSPYVPSYITERNYE
jgi:DNA ligase-1